MTSSASSTHVFWLWEVLLNVSKSLTCLVLLSWQTCQFIWLVSLLPQQWVILLPGQGQISVLLPAPKSWDAMNWHTGNSAKANSCIFRNPSFQFFIKLLKNVSCNMISRQAIYPSNYWLSHLLSSAFVHGVFLFRHLRFCRVDCPSTAMQIQPHHTFCYCTCFIKSALKDNLWEPAVFPVQLISFQLAVLRHHVACFISSLRAGLALYLSAPEPSSSSPVPAMGKVGWRGCPMEACSRVSAAVASSPSLPGAPPCWAALPSPSWKYRMALPVSCSGACFSTKLSLGRLHPWPKLHHLPL